MSQSSHIWIENGRPVQYLAEHVAESEINERSSYERGCVRFTTGDQGTEVKWQVQSPCLSSLFYVINVIGSRKPPFVLRFCASGWFEEFYRTSEMAAKRIEDVISRGDRHFTTKTFVQEVDPSGPLLSPLLSNCFFDASQVEERAIDCVYEEASQQFVVERVGQKSPIGEHYGTFLSSFPCQASAYSDMVSQGYKQVLETGRARSDHVIAAFRLPDNQVHWVPYQRLILPNFTSNTPKVAVVSEISPISFVVI